MTLAMAEEILLLSLDEAGRPVGVPAPAVDLALAGAVLMDLALAGRVDSDPDRLFLAQREPTGDALLDEVLACIATQEPPRDTRWWMEDLSRDAARLRRAFLDRLVIRGVLRRVEGRVLWVLPDRRYPVADGAPVREVRARLRDVLLGGDIPETRDALLVGLCRATGLVGLVLSEAEARDAAARLDAVAAMEEMSRSLLAAARDLHAAMTDYGTAH